MPKDTRINVHLYDLRDRLDQVIGGYGEISKLIRSLLRAYLEGSIMYIDRRVHILLDEGKEKEAAKLLADGLIKLRQVRLQAGSAATRRRAAKKTAQAQQKAGIQSPQEKLAQEMMTILIKQIKEGAEDNDNN